MRSKHFIQAPREAVPCARPPQTRDDLIARSHWSDIANNLELNQRRKFLDRQPADNHRRGLRFEQDFESQLLQLSEGLRGLVDEPYLNLGLAVADEPRYATVNGLVKMFDDQKLLERVSRNELGVLQNAEIPFEA